MSQEPASAVHLRSTRSKRKTENSPLMRPKTGPALMNARGIPTPEGSKWYATQVIRVRKEVSREMNDETAHLIREYRTNAERMRARANSVSSPAMRAQFEQIARELDHLADQEEVRVTGDRTEKTRPTKVVGQALE